MSLPYFAGESAAWAEIYGYDEYGRPNAVNRNTGRNTGLTYSGATVNETTAGKTTTKTFGPDGTLTSAGDNGGTLTYTYYPDGKVKNISAPGGAVTSMQYNDAARNQTLLSDPSAGNTSYTYNSRGQLLTQTDNQSRTTTYTYHSDGRVNTISSPEGTTTYNYNPNTGQLVGIDSPNNVIRSYSYDSMGRINSTGDNIAGTTFSTTFTYDSYGRLETKNHNSLLTETYSYNNQGYMSSISAGGATRYTVTSMNAREQLTGATYGGSISATYGFDGYGYPTSTQTGTIQDYRYDFDPYTGNLSSRQNYLKGKLESFGYDNLDRLTSVSGPQNLTMTFQDNGNINTKSDIGSAPFGYGAGAGPYALSSVTSSSGVIPTAAQNVSSYNSFQKLVSIGEDGNTASFLYNADHERARMIQTGANSFTRWYHGESYMRETSSAGTKDYIYLGGDAYSAPVAAVIENGTPKYHYLLRDYLGNITHDYDSYYGTTREYSFDAWGRRRNPADWGYDISGEPELFAGRGFTSHEFLKEFNVYNMNGRLYDPLVGRFLSADIVVQAPDYSQSYNRYSYCLNNPLKFTDPSGYTLSNTESGSWVEEQTELFRNSFGAGGGGGGGYFGYIGFDGRFHGDSWYNSYTNATLHGYTAGASEFMHNYYSQTDSPTFNGTITYWTEHTSTIYVEGCSLPGAQVTRIKHTIPINKFSLSGMYTHFQFGGGQPMAIKASSLDFSRTTQRQLGLTGMAVGDIKPVNLFKMGSLNPIALAFGRVNIEYKGYNQFSILTDESSRFDFNPLIDTGASFGRNIGNLLGAAINYNLNINPVGSLVPSIFGGPYDVYFIGTVTIPNK